MDRIKMMLVVSDYYREISENLELSARTFLSEKNAECSCVYVPGALEIPPAISLIAEGGSGFHGYVALGCVIRGETSHYDIVAENSARGLMDLGIHKGLCIGNGILTVENMDHAVIRSSPEGRNTGKWAALAALMLVTLRMKGVQPGNTAWRHQL